LDTGTGETDNDDCLPRPLVLESDRDTDIAEDHDQDIWNHRWQTHLRLTDATVASCCACGDPIAEWAGCSEANESTDEYGEVCEACLSQQFFRIVWCGACNLPML